MISIFFNAFMIQFHSLNQYLKLLNLNMEIPFFTLVKFVLSIHTEHIN